jgi:hypothetical protein
MFLKFLAQPQVNEDSGNRRPIMLEVTPSSPPASADQGKTPSETDKTNSAPDQAKTTEQQSTGTISRSPSRLLEVKCYKYTILLLFRSR